MITKKKSKAMSFLDSLIGESENFGSLIEAFRLADGKTQTEYAKKLGIPRQHLCDIEKGRRIVSIEKASKFAKKLGHSEISFIRLVLQDQVNQAKLKFKIEVEAA